MTSRRASLFALLVFGCATTREPDEQSIAWQKAGASMQELEADRADCDGLASPKEPSGGEADELQRHNAFISCMKGRGWTPVP